MLVKNLNSTFQFSTGRFPAELAKAQPKPQTHLLTFAVRHCWGILVLWFLWGLITAEWQDSLVLFPFFPVAVLSCVLVDTENIFFMLQQQGHSQHTQTPHTKGNFSDYKWCWWYDMDFNGVKRSPLNVAPSKTALKKWDCRQKNTLPTEPPPQLYQDQFLDLHRP